jgi:hypothetical protein
MTRRAPSLAFSQRPRGVCRLLIAIVAFGLLLAAPPTTSALDASSTAILANPDRFDGKTVTIRGTITNVRETVSRRGNPYYTFDLSDGTRSIRVFSFGTAPCRVGMATVEGTFDKVKHVGGRTFRNEVTASQVTCR